MTWRTRFRAILWVLTWLALLPWPPLVRAHSELVTADPPPGAPLTTAPAEIRLTFSAPLMSGSTFAVWGENFQQVAELAPQIDPQRPDQLFATIPPLAAGDYTVQWTAVANDGHRFSGSYAFRFLDAPESSGPAIGWWVAAVGVSAVALVHLIRHVITCRRAQKADNR